MAYLYSNQPNTELSLKKTLIQKGLRAEALHGGPHTLHIIRLI